jgi:iron(III) transport system substrate-binding protein
MQRKVTDKLFIILLLVFTISTLTAEINVYSHRHYDSDKILFKQFTKETGIKINIIKGSADQLIQRLISEGDNSPADVLLTVDAGRLERARAAGILQPVQSKTLLKNVPAAMRDPDGYWYGLTVRARVIVYAKDRVKENELSTYENLADSKWKGRVVVRSSSNIYNQSLLASMIAANGSKKALSWAIAVRKNMARTPRGSDRDQARAVAAGIADVAIINTYYLGKLANSSDIADREVASKVGVFFPNQNGRGTHINVSGGGVTSSSKNKDEAIKFLEFLSNAKSQETFGNVNYEYPVKIKENKSALLKSWGSFKADKINLSILGANNTEAVKLYDRAGWE